MSMILMNDGDLESWVNFFNSCLTVNQQKLIKINFLGGPINFPFEISLRRAECGILNKSKDRIDLVLEMRKLREDEVFPRSKINPNFIEVFW